MRGTSSLCLLAVLLLTAAADARWKPQYADVSPEVSEWFKAQHNKQGQWCCDQTDGHRFDGTYWFKPDGSVVVETNGNHYEIEAFKVLNGHNPTSGAVWWYSDNDAGRITYCFSPGSMS